jgi:hypothetical protein
MAKMVGIAQVAQTMRNDDGKKLPYTGILMKNPSNKAVKKV